MNPALRNTITKRSLRGTVINGTTVIDSGAEASDRPVLPGAVVEFDGVDGIIDGAAAIDNSSIEFSQYANILNNSVSSQVTYSLGNSSYDSSDLLELSFSTFSRQCRITIGDGDSSSESVFFSPLPPSTFTTWFLVEVIRVGDQVELKINGASQGFKTLSVNASGVSTGYTVGAKQVSLGVNSDFTDGKIGPTTISGLSLNLNETSGLTAYDSSGNSNDGTLSATGATRAQDNTIPFDADRANLDGYSKRMYFDGVDNHVNLGVDPVDLNGKSFTASVKIFSSNPSSAWRSLCSRGLGSAGSVTGFQIGGSTSLNNTLIDDGLGNSVFAAGTTVLTPNTLYEVMIAWDTTTGALSVYIDGLLDWTGANPAMIGANLNTLGDTLIGTAPNSIGSQSFNGVIYDVNINDESLYNGYGNTDADWTDQIGSKDGTVNGSPALLRLPASAVDPTVDALLGEPLTNPPVLHPGGQYGHNDAETTEDSYNVSETGAPVVGTSNLANFDAIIFDDSNSHLISTAPIDAVYRRAASTISRDRLIAFYDSLTGTDKTLALKYTEGSAWDDLVIWDDTEEWAD